MMLFIVMLALLVLGVPIAAAMGISSLGYVLANGMNPIVVVQRVFSGIDQSAYLAIPFFVLAGEIMNQGGIARRIVAMVQRLVGNVTGGLGVVAIISVMFFGAISGSAIASAVAIGGVMCAGLLRNGYGRGFSAALIASAAPMDNIIPPSIGLVIYGVLSRTSIGDLYKLGFPTGVLVGLALIVPTIIIAKKRNFKGQAEKIASGEIVLNNVPEITVSGDETKAQFWLYNILALLSPVIIVGGVFMGVFTPTESAVVACVYSLIVGMFVYKDIKVKDLHRIFLNAAKSTSTLMLIMAVATLFSYVMTYDRIPQRILEVFSAWEASNVAKLMLMNVILLIAGMFMEAGSIQYIAVPVLLPIAQQMGISPLHFGMIITTNLSIGMMTPPFGITLFASMRVFNVSMQEVVKNMIPFLIALIAALFIVTFVPDLIMWIV